MKDSCVMGTDRFRDAAVFLCGKMAVKKGN